MSDVLVNPLLDDRARTVRCSRRSGGIQYAYSATQNSGRITQATDTVSGETIVYQYDALKRLTSTSSTPINGSTPTAWTQSFQYDGFGNLVSKTLNGGANLTPAVNPATNQLACQCYDLNGNMTSGVSATFTYDEANRMITAQEVSGGREYYGYDAANKRVYRMTASGQEQLTFYGVHGEKLGVYGVQGSGCGFSGVSLRVYAAEHEHLVRRAVADGFGQ